MKQNSNKDCEPEEAWQLSNETIYKLCTKEITEFENLGSIIDIEAFVQSPGYSPNSLWYLFEENDNNGEEYSLYGLDTAIKRIKDVAANLPSTNACQGDCLERVRYVTIQLVMLKWGYFGPLDASAGHYLAYYRSEIGSYFVNSINNLWPYHPLHNPPNDFEIRLNKVLMELTKQIYKGRISDVSVLDLAAFGSEIKSLNYLQTDDANWPNEINFAFYNHASGNMSAVFKELKQLKHAWSQYIMKITEKNSNSILKFPIDKTSTLFNYSSFIAKDIETFLTIYSATFPTPLQHNQRIWESAANKVFKHTIRGKFQDKYEIYDKLVVKCSFKEKLGENFDQKTESFGGCTHFNPSLTSNGLCYTFNGLQPSSIWQPSRITRAIEEKTTKDLTLQKFGGVGSNEGDYLTSK